MMCRCMCSLCSRIFTTTKTSWTCRELVSENHLTYNYKSADRTDASSKVADTPTASGSLISTAASVAVAAGRRAAAATLTSQQPATAPSPDTDGPRKEVRCVEGYEKNLYVGRSDGVVEWWVLDSTAPNTTVCIW